MKTVFDTRYAIRDTRCAMCDVRKLRHPFVLKTTFLLCLLSYLFNPMQAQTDWRITGNTVTADSRLGTNTAYDIILETNNTERMRIKGAGNIGIGTNNPQSKLELVGDFRLGGDLSFPLLANGNADAFRFTYIDQTGQLRAGSGDQFVASAYRGDCFLRDGSTIPSPAWNSLSGTEYGILYTGETCPARVGIGTQLPLTSLHVAGNGYLTRLHLGHANAISNDYKLSIWDAPGGLLSPRSIFDLRNDGTAKFSFWGESTGTPFAIWNGAGSDWFANMHGDGAMDFNYYGTGGVALSVFDKTLNQNIAALTSDGKWWCQGIVVRHVPFWGDFVFEPTYTLMPLQEVETYIEENHHLPALPSAAEIEKDGLEVEEMIRLLTIKIEELTLHAIEQEKEIEALKSQLSQPATEEKK